MAKKNRSEVKSSHLALLKLKKKKLKERAFVELIETQRNSESGYHEAVKPLKEKKPKKADKEKKNRKLAVNTKRKKRTNNGDNDEDQLSHKDANDVDGKKSGMTGNNRVTNSSYSGMLSAISDIEEPMNANIETKSISKWLIEYKESRPGLKILQQRNDDFIAAYEAQQEQERIEREARVAEGGWTVVTHHKGRKKSTDMESGISVGSVAQASLMDKVAKKKSKEVGLDFYRFQRREAQRNDVMKLQSKFEVDKRRIQQLRAARKFRPF